MGSPSWRCTATKSKRISAAAKSTRAAEEREWRKRPRQDQCCLAQQTCLLYETANMSAVWHGRHGYYVIEQTWLLRQTADLFALSCSSHVCRITPQACPAVSQRRQVCCDTLQTCLLYHAENMSVVTQGRDVCCFTQQTCLL